MKIAVSKHSGFCFGVRRAVNLTQETLRGKRRVYSLGPLIHNRCVVSKLSCNGLKVIKDIDCISKGYCVIPSHGIDPNKLKKNKELIFIDATCPFVFKAQALIRQLTNAGYDILILGDEDHPEVKGLVGISKGKSKVLKDENQAISFLCKGKKIALISQTTQSPENFRAVASKLIEKDFQELRIYNTICKDVIERQDEAKKIAKKVELVLVIGGKNSANTKRLVETCSSFTKTHHIEDEKEIKKEWFKNVRQVGIITGASTPGEFIGRVKRKIKGLLPK